MACFINFLNHNLLFSCVWKLLIDEYDDVDDDDDDDDHDDETNDKNNIP